MSHPGRIAGCISGCLPQASASEQKTTTAFPPHPNAVFGRIQHELPTIFVDNYQDQEIEDVLIVH